MKKWLVVLVLIVAVGGYYWLTGSATAVSPLDRAPPVVRTEQVAFAAVNDTLEALGTVRALEALTVSARVTGTVQQVSFSDNSVVDKGAELIALDAANERAALLEAEVNLQEDQRLLDHYLTLDRTGAVSRTLLEEQRAKVAVSRARVAAAKAQLDDFVVRAPFAGLLGVRKVSVGALVSPGTAITTLDAISSVKLDFTVPERWLSQLAAGQLLAARSIAWPDEVFNGTVTSIGSRVEPTTRAVQVVAELDNPELRLRPGMLLTIHLISESRNALLVSEKALVQEGSERFVFIVEDSRVERRTVHTGRRFSDRVEIVDGLSAGEQIVIEGAQKVRAGSRVNPLTAGGDG